MLPQHESILAQRFRVRAQIGYATLGWLYRALDEKQGGEVALRMVLGVRHADVTCTRLRALIEALPEMTGLATTYDCGVWNGQLWFTSEWMCGVSLEHSVANTGALLPIEVVRIGIDVARALDAAHQRGLVHRGLKTRTIFFDRECVKVAEFGVAAAILADAPLMPNTPGSMAPEQVFNGVIDRRVDVYSLGCCLFTAAVGRTPFDGGSGAQIIAAQSGWRAPRAMPI